MSLKLITPPAALAVSLAAARTSARVDGEDHDSELQQIVEAYTSDAEHKTGRAFVEQTYRLTLDAFPAAFRLDMPPILSVKHVKYVDPDGVLRTLAPADYLLDAESEPGYLMPAPGRAWPATQPRANAVEVVYTAGYGPDESTVPPEVKRYILGKVSEHFAPAGTPKNEFLDSLLDRVKVYA